MTGGGHSGSRYSPLSDYLAALGGSEAKMTFGEVENLVGGLPDSARRHRAWWSNSSHVARAWQDAGWHLHSVNQVTEQVVFVRATDSGRSRARNYSPSARGPYIDVRVIAAITARHAQDQFDCAKLLRLVEELNDNYVRGGTYAVHVILRAILDHIPPLLGCANFTAAVNNYPWGRTDRAYMKRLLDFKLQADDALHRQISTQADLLSLDDVPPRVWINRLLQECASPGTSAKGGPQNMAIEKPRQRLPDAKLNQNVMPRHSKPSLPAHGPVVHRTERIVIRLTQGCLNNNYVPLAKHLDFFPAAAVGAAKVQDEQGELLTLHFAGFSDAVITDIAGNHKIFRRRDAWGKFFVHHRLVEGDSVAIERLSPYNYRIFPAT